MKENFRKLFWFILKNFEKGDEPYHYKPLNRKILIFVGSVFLFLGGITLYLTILQGDLGYIIPVIVLLVVGIVCFVVGILGSERAVSKIWGNR